MSEQFEPHAELPPEPMLSEAETRRLVERLEAQIKETEQLERAIATRPQPSAEPVAWMHHHRKLREAALSAKPLTRGADEFGWTETPLFPASALEAARREALEQAAKVIETAGLDPNVSNHLDARMCCTGHMCGCQGSTVAEYLAYQLRALKENPNAG